MRYAKKKQNINLMQIIPGIGFDRESACTRIACTKIASRLRKSSGVWKAELADRDARLTASPNVASQPAVYN